MSILKKPSAWDIVYSIAMAQRLHQAPQGKCTVRHGAPP
jgi:hypothetical protein